MLGALLSQILAGASLNTETVRPVRSSSATCLDFPTRPRHVAPGKNGNSRFPCEVLPYVHGVFDRAGSQHTSRYRYAKCGLPLLLTASTSRSKFLTRLDTRPICSPVNASMPPLRVAPHDSGSMWLAIPSSCDFSFTTPRRFCRRTRSRAC
jgi:hypothetical protein